MKQTTLAEKTAISLGIKWGKSYSQLAEELQLTERVVRKWGQKAKKKRLLRKCHGSPQDRLFK